MKFHHTPPGRRPLACSALEPAGTGKTRAVHTDGPYPERRPPGGGPRTRPAENGESDALGADSERNAFYYVPFFVCARPGAAENMEENIGKQGAEKVWSDCMGDFLPCETHSAEKR